MKIAKTVWLAPTHLRIRSSDAQERHPICRKWLQFMTVLPLLYLEWPENVSQLSPLVEPLDDVGVLKWDALRFIIRVQFPPLSWRRGADYLGRGTCASVRLP